ncbi:FKBP-type peptidyl-prolyl cis-trans isomerase [Brevibacterium antiquum]|uniref:Peptidyl-prolyl cis-trans isomerase n=1 Tax=Brevibacterium antiquum TaxID=234835 RepID=A0A2H1HSQ1_9MICO|nr:FKBP-type peptidyl-prolyl cis-trans isomerase [Brevibacterium antiquum]SMX65937.1 peptidylprolyl isomerase [Brevibacterium antiquum]
MRTKVLAVIAAATLLLSACGQGEEAENTTSAPPSVSAEDAKSTSLDDITVEGKMGEKPKVSFDAPLVVDKVTDKTISKGDGKKVAKGDRVDADLTMYSGNTGELVESSYDSDAPASIMMNVPDGVSQDLYDVLIGKPVGTRVAMTINGSPDNSQTSQTLVYVFDIKDSIKPLTRAEGKKVDQSKDPVTVTLADNGEPSISQPKGKAPTELESYTTIEGEGPKVKEGQKVAVQYSGWLWDDNSKYFDSSWQDGREPFAVDPVGQAQVIDGWNEGLVGAKVGSQIVLVVPPDKGYGEQGRDGIPANSTLVFVIDILSAVG